MIRVCTFLVALLSMLLPTAATGAASPEDWQRVLDLPSGTVAAATFATDDVAWAAGESGIFRSEDRGRTWQVAHESSGFLADVDAAPGGMHGWAVGVLGGALYTADGGQTWTVRDVGSELNLNLVEVLDADSVIIAGVGEAPREEVVGPQPHTIRRTDDGGNTWREIELDGFTAMAISFIDARLGWISGRRCEPRADGNRYGCVSRAAALFRTEDGGATWARVGGDGLYRTLAFTSKDDGWATRADCTNPSDDDCSWRVAATHDGGESWTDLRIGYDDFPLQLSVFADSAALVYEFYCQTEGECASHLIETTDGGDTWTEVHKFEEPFGNGAPIVAPAGHAISFSYGGSPAYSTNRRDWLPAEFPLTVGPGAFDFIDSQDGWVAASKLLRTTDAGATWEPLSDFRLIELDFVSATDGWATTSSRQCAFCVTLHHTSDGGRTWRAQYEWDGETGREWGDHLYLTAVDALNAWAYAIHDRVLLHTRDGGATWYEQPFIVESRGTGSPAVTFVDARVGWLMEPFCEPELADCVIRTSITGDGGDTWPANSPIDSGGGCPTLIEAVSALHAWIISADCGDYARRLQNLSAAARAESPVLPYILRTTDGGVSWQRVDIGGEGRVTEIDFFDPQTGRIIRTQCEEPPGICTDTILRTQDGGRNWTSEPTGMQTDGAVLFVAPERAWRLWQDAGAFDDSRHQLYRFVGPGTDAPLPLPTAGRGVGRTALIALLLVGGALFAGVGLTIIRKRRGA